VSLCGVWAIHSLGIMWMIVIFTIIQIGWLMVWFGLVKRKIGYRLIQLAQDIVPFLGCTLGVIILVWYVTLQIQNVYVLFLTKVLLVAGSYCLIMRIFRANIYQESIHYFLRILHRGEKK
jgi:hypothetical protein